MAGEFRRIWKSLNGSVFFLIEAEYLTMGLEGIQIIHLIHIPTPSSVFSLK